MELSIALVGVYAAHYQSLEGAWWRSAILMKETTTLTEVMDSEFLITPWCVKGANRAWISEGESENLRWGGGACKFGSSVCEPERQLSSTVDGLADLTRSDWESLVNHVTLYPELNLLETI